MELGYSLIFIGLLELSRVHPFFLTITTRKQQIGFEPTASAQAMRHSTSWVTAAKYDNFLLSRHFTEVLSNHRFLIFQKFVVVSVQSPQAWLAAFCTWHNDKSLFSKAHFKERLLRRRSHWRSSTLQAIRSSLYRSSYLQILDSNQCLRFSEAACFPLHQFVSY